jgi:hypothetical protein
MSTLEDEQLALDAVLYLALTLRRLRRYLTGPPGLAPASGNA